jgi:hypothetical protein
MMSLGCEHEGVEVAWSSTEGEQWQDANCGDCVHDSERLVAAGKGCGIILDTLSGMAPECVAEGQPCPHRLTREDQAKRPRRVGSRSHAGMVPMLEVS